MLDTLKKGAAILILGVALFVLTLVGYSITQSVRADGQVEYCWIEYNSGSSIPYWELRGFRSWRSDLRIAVTKTESEALELSQKINCRIGTRR